MRNSQNRYFYHIFVSLGDAPGVITLNVVWTEREFEAYKLSRSMYPCIFNSFPDIRTASAKKRHFHVPPPTFLFPLGRPCGNHAKCCMDGKRTRCLQIASLHFWDTARYLWTKSSFYHTPLHSTPPLGGFPSEYRHPLWDGKTRMVSLSDGEKISKISLFVLTWSTNVTDRQTDRRTLRDSKDRACIASRGKNVQKLGGFCQIWYQATAAFISTFRFFPIKSLSRNLRISPITWTPVDYVLDEPAILQQSFQSQWHDARRWLRHGTTWKRSSSFSNCLRREGAGRSTNDFVACSHELTHVHNLSCSSCTALWTPWWVSQRVDDTDDQLFSAVLTNSHHVLHHMLPDRTSYRYTLRPRRHDCSLIKEDARNFIILLFSALWYIS